MSKLTLTRRSFVKLSAITAAASGLSFAAKPSEALAEGTDPTAGKTYRIRSCCRACGKIECGVWVTVEDNKVIKVEGDESNAHSRGHCCAKSQSSMLALYHPDRLRYVQKRTNPKGEDDPGWIRIPLAQAFDEAGAKFSEIVAKYGGQSCFSMGGTSRVWAQPPYGTLKSVFPTPNAHLAYEICKGPRHFGGILTDERGSPWMEVEQGPLVYVQWGTASEYSNYDSCNRTVCDCSQRAYKHILVDPRQTPLGKEADLWLPLRVGTDLCLSLGWLKWIIDNEAYDDLFVRRWSNAPFLWNPEEDGKTFKGRFQESTGEIDMTSRLITEADCDPDWVNQYWDYEGRFQRFIVWDENNNKPTFWDAEECQWEGEKHKIPTTGVWVEHPYKPIMADAWLPDPSHFADPKDSTYDNYWKDGNEGGKRSNPKGLPKNPALFVNGSVEIKLKNGKTIKPGTAWESFLESLQEYTLDYVSEVTEVPADAIEEGVRLYTTRLNPLYGNGGIHYQLAPDQTGHAVQNTRSLQIIACITGNSDEPAGNRGSCKAQVDGCCGRANMLVTDYSNNYGRDGEDKRFMWNVYDDRTGKMDFATMELGNTPRDLTVEEQIPLIQDFVKYLIDEKSPLAERYGNHVPSDDEAMWIAYRKGGNYHNSKSWPNPTPGFDRLENQISAERFPLLRYWGAWADSATIWDSINSIEAPYQIHGEVCMSGDFMNESNLLEAWEAQTRLDFYIDFNLWSCPNNGCADIVIPCTHWLETNTGRVSQGAGGIFGAGQRAVVPFGDIIFDPTSVICLYKAMGVKWNTRDTLYDYWNSIDYHNFVQMLPHGGYAYAPFKQNDEGEWVKQDINNFENQSDVAIWLAQDGRSYKVGKDGSTIWEDDEAFASADGTTYKMPVEKLTEENAMDYEEQEYRVLQDATDWWKIEEMRDIDDRDQEADIERLGREFEEEGTGLWLADRWKTPRMLELLKKKSKKYGPDWPRYAAKFQDEGWFDERVWHPERWGTYRRWEMGYRRQMSGYNLYPAMDEKCAFMLPTGKVEIWSTIAESYIGDDRPTFAHVCSPERAAYEDTCKQKGIKPIPDIDKFPHWFEPKNSKRQAPWWYNVEEFDRVYPEIDHAVRSDGEVALGLRKDQVTGAYYINDNYKGDHLLDQYGEFLHKYPDNAFIATTGSRQPVYFHSEHRQLPWCRELWPSPRMEMNPNDAARLGLEQGDWIWLRSPWGAIREVLDLYYGIKEGTVNCNHAWWYPEFDTASHGFELVNINCCMDKYAQCWICGASQLRGLPLLIYKATPENSPFGNPVPCDPWGNEAITNARDPRLKEWMSNDPRLHDAKVELTFYNPDAKGLTPTSVPRVDADWM